MSVITQYGNYVKFLRGTPAAYQQATKDPDTLYFISEDNATQGVLYLGTKLISGSLTGSTTLADLTDVLIGAGIEAGSLLYYDGSQWINKSLAEIFSIIVGPMRGATATTDGATGTVPAPQAGQQDLYLKGDGTWADPTASLQGTVNLIVGQVGTLIGNDTDKSVREIAQAEVNKIVDGAPAALDTLKEIADYITEHPTESNVAERLVALENAIFTTDTGLVDRTTVIETAVGNLQDALAAIEARDDAQDQAISDLQDKIKALRWQNMMIV